MEIELKWEIPSGLDLQKIESKLIELGFSKGEESHQIDVYFTKDDQAERRTNFLINDERAYLRTRHDVMNGTFSINCKVIKDFFGVCDEHEADISNKKSFDECEKILNLLGYHSSVPVDKKRVVWHKDNVSVCLDKVVNLGEFIEIEIMSDKNKDDVFAEIKRIGNEFGLTDSSLRKGEGYPDMLIGKI